MNIRVANNLGLHVGPRGGTAVALPANTAAPSISGTPTQGQTLTGTDGTWTLSPTLTRQWLRNGSTISGATASTYLLVTADVGATIALRVIANGTVTAVSTGVGPVAAVGTIPQNVLIEGDSITTTSPDVSIDSYAWRWVNANPTKVSHVRAQGSRALGVPANLNDAGNTLYGHRSEDLAYGYPLWTILIGANDLMFSPSSQDYFDRLKAYIAPIRTSGAKVAFCTVMPFDNRHASYVGHNALRDGLNALMYSNTSELCDYVIPLGEIPEMNTGVNPNPGLSDGVHPSPAGITWLAEAYAAALDALVAGNTATTPAGTAWFGADITASAQSAVYLLRYCVRGLTPGTTVTVSVAGTGSRFLVGRGAYGTTSQTVRNGDIILLELTASSALSTNRAFSITMGSSSQTFNLQTAAVAPATTTFSTTLKNAGIVLSNTNRDMDGNGAGGAYAVALSSTSKSSGKWKIEFTPLLVANSPFCGFATAAYDYTLNARPGHDNANGVSFEGDTAWYNAGSSTYLAAGFGSANVPQTLFADIDLGKCWLAVNGAIVGGGSPSAGTGGIPLPAGAIRAYAVCRTGSDKMRINAGQEAMALAISAFLDWG